MLNTTPPSVADLLLEAPFSILGAVWAKLHSIVAEQPQEVIEDLFFHGGTHFPLMRVLLRDMIESDSDSPLLEQDKRHFMLPVILALYQTVAAAIEAKGRASGIAEAIANSLPLRKKRGGPVPIPYPPADQTEAKAELRAWIETHGLLELEVHEETSPSVPSQLMESVATAYWHCRVRTQVLSGGKQLSLGTTSVPITATAFGRRGSTGNTGGEIASSILADSIDPDSFELSDEASVDTDGDSDEEDVDEAVPTTAQTSQDDADENEDDAVTTDYKLAEVTVRHAVCSPNGDFLCLVVDTVEERQGKKDPSPINIHIRDLLLQHATFWYKMNADKSKAVFHHGGSPGLGGMLRARQISRLIRRQSIDSKQNSISNQVSALHCLCFF